MTGKPMTEHEKAKAAQRELYRRRMQDPAYRARKKAAQTASQGQSTLIQSRIPIPRTSSTIKAGSPESVCGKPNRVDACQEPECPLFAFRRGTNPYSQTSENVTPQAGKERKSKR